MSWTLTTSGAIVRLIGLNGNSEIKVSAAALVEASDAAEANLCIKTRYDWVTNYTSVASHLRPTLSDATASYAAINLIGYDPSGYTNQDEVITKVNILLNNYDRIVNTLKEQETKDFLGVS